MMNQAPFNPALMSVDPLSSLVHYPPMYSPVAPLPKIELSASQPMKMPGSDSWEGFEYPTVYADGSSSSNPSSPSSPYSPVEYVTVPTVPHTPVISDATVAAPSLAQPLGSHTVAVSSERQYSRSRRRSKFGSHSSVSSSDSLPPSTIQELLKEQDLKRQRLARKAELARVSRKRKQTRISELEEEVVRLQAEIERVKKHRRLDQEVLAKQAQQLSEVNAQQMAASAEKEGPTESVPAAIQKVLRSIVEAQNRVGQPGPHGEDNNASNGQGVGSVVSNLTDELLELFKRQEVSAKLHLTALESHLTPSMPLQFLLWAMNQNEKFYTDPCGLWHSLFTTEIGVSQEQMNEILSLRQSLKAQQQLWREVESTFSCLDSRVRTHLSNFTGNLSHLRGVLSPEQMGKFFAWVERFGPVCVKINL